LLPGDDDGHVALERWYRRSARAEVEPRLDTAVRALGSSYTSLRIADARTRWGSCSPTGAISISWRLMLAPEQILDYVVWHEACHLVVMSHAPHFWELLARHVPDYATHRRWLRHHAALLAL
jgi:predicted metal-dependent hydrolase